MGAAMFWANGGENIRFKYRKFVGVADNVEATYNLRNFFWGVLPKKIYGLVGDRKSTRLNSSHAT